MTDIVHYNMLDIERTCLFPNLYPPNHDYKKGPGEIHNFLLVDSTRRLGARMRSNLLKIQRQQQILEHFKASKQARVAELSGELRVSEATIRRDLQELSLKGSLQRTHGGALVSERVEPEPPLQQRAREHAEEKKRIGQAAADLVSDNETIFIGSGTTTSEVAKALVGKRRITVITNALNIANLVANDPNIELVVLGGFLRRTEMSLVGHLTVENLKEVHSDKVIVGMHAIDCRHGLTSDYLPEILTDRQIIHSTSCVIVVADHSKLGKVSAALVAPLRAVQQVITDTGAPDVDVQALRDEGIRVTLV